jgi:hypothetical protein
LIRCKCQVAARDGPVPRTVAGNPKRAAMPDLSNLHDRVFKAASGRPVVAADFLVSTRRRRWRGAAIAQDRSVGIM